MNKIILNNKNLAFIVKELGAEFNKIEFLNWYRQVNPNFQFEHGLISSGGVNKYFSGNKEHIKLYEFPELEIKNENDLKIFVSHPHGSYREPIIKLLKNEFGLDYWQTTLNFACEDEKVGYSVYHGILSHSMNDWNFTETNIEKIKNFLDKFIDSANRSKSKRFSEILQYMSFCITNKESFGNAWLVESLNQIFKNPDDGSSKIFNFQVDKISRQFMDLDFKGLRLNSELRKAIKGKLPLTTNSSNTMPFFWEIDIPRYGMANKTVQNLLQTNCITGMDAIDKFLKDETDVLSHFVKREKSKISLSVIHENPKLEEKLHILLDTILNKSKMNLIVEKSDFEKAIVFISLSESMETKNTKVKTVKV